MKETVNLEMLNEIMDNDDELIRECFADYKSDYVNSLGLIKQSIDENNPLNLQKSSHAFKGSLKYLAADIAAKYALELEKMGANGSIDKDKALMFYEKLEEACKDLESYIDKY